MASITSYRSSSVTVKFCSSMRTFPSHHGHVAFERGRDASDHLHCIRDTAEIRANTENVRDNHQATGKP